MKNNDNQEKEKTQDGLAPKFADELQRLMADKGLKQVDIEERSKGAISQALVSSFLLRGSLPRSLDKVDQLSDILGIDRQRLRRVVAMDEIKRVLSKNNVSWSEVSKAAKAEQKESSYVPLFDLQEIDKHFSKGGYPGKEAKEGSRVQVGAVAGAWTYGIEIKNTIIVPRAFPGEIAVFSPSFKEKCEGDYALVCAIERGAEKVVLIGKVIEMDSGVSIETVSPYSHRVIRKKNVQYIHRIVAVIKPLQPH